ncbi:MAG: hypothetical protein IMF06_14875 [Proteobacteria bacterium]|nr:hypothetical protein [Pseudomonadota bacterium]
MKKNSVNRLILFAPLVVFGLAGSYFLVVFLRETGEGAFKNSLLPELIGFCLEGFFLVGLFSLVQRLLERDRKDELRRSLRGALREILSHLDLAVLGEYAEPASSQSLEDDPQSVATLIVKLNERELDLDNMANIKAAAGRNLRTMHDLIPVAAQLSADHMRWWLALADSVRHLSEAKDKASVTFSAHRFLANLAEFDGLHL